MVFFSGRDILVVDDHKDIAELMKIALQKDGFTVHTFYDPLSAFTHFKEHADIIALVIADIRMPSMSGIELISKIKEVVPDIKAILITAFDIDSINEEIKRFGVDIIKIYQKPIILKKLRLDVMQFLQGSLQKKKQME